MMLPFNFLLKHNCENDKKVSDSDIWGVQVSLCVSSGHFQRFKRNSLLSLTKWRSCAVWMLQKIVCFIACQSLSIDINSFINKPSKIHRTEYLPANSSTIHSFVVWLSHRTTVLGVPGSSPLRSVSGSLSTLHWDRVKAFIFDLNS